MPVRTKLRSREAISAKSRSHSSAFPFSGKDGHTASFTQWLAPTTRKGRPVAAQVRRSRGEARPFREEGHLAPPEPGLVRLDDPAAAFVEGSHRVEAGARGVAEGQVLVRDAVGAGNDPRVHHPSVAEHLETDAAAVGPVVPARLPVLHVDDHFRTLLVAERRAGHLDPEESRPSRRVPGRLADQGAALVRRPVAGLGLEVEHDEAAAAFGPGGLRGEREVEPRHRAAILRPCSSRKKPRPRHRPSETRSWPRSASSPRTRGALGCRPSRIPRGRPRRNERSRGGAPRSRPRPRGGASSRPARGRGGTRCPRGRRVSTAGARRGSAGCRRPPGRSGWRPTRPPGTRSRTGARAGPPRARSPASADPRCRRRSGEVRREQWPTSPARGPRSRPQGNPAPGRRPCRPPRRPRDPPPAVAPPSTSAAWNPPGAVGRREPTTGRDYHAGFRSDRRDLKTRCAVRATEAGCRSRSCARAP